MAEEVKRGGIIYKDSINVPAVGKTFNINVTALCPDVTKWKVNITGNIKDLIVYDYDGSSTSSTPAPSDIDSPKSFTVRSNRYGEKSGTLFISGYTSAETETCNKGPMDGSTLLPNVVYAYPLYMKAMYKRTPSASINLIMYSGGTEVPVVSEFVEKTAGGRGKLTVTATNGIPFTSSVTISNNFVSYDGKLEDNISVYNNPSPSARSSRITVTVTTTETSEYYSSTTVQSFLIRQKAVPAITVRQNGLQVPVPSDGGSFTVIMDTESDGELTWESTGYTTTSTIAPAPTPDVSDEPGGGGGGNIADSVSPLFNNSMKGGLILGDGMRGDVTEPPAWWNVQESFSMDNALNVQVQSNSDTTSRYIVLGINATSSETDLYAPGKGSGKFVISQAPYVAPVIPPEPEPEPGGETTPSPIPTPTAKTVCAITISDQYDMSSTAITGTGSSKSGNKCTFTSTALKNDGSDPFVLKIKPKLDKTSTDLNNKLTVRVSSTVNWIVFTGTTSRTGVTAGNEVQFSFYLNPITTAFQRNGKIKYEILATNFETDTISYKFTNFSSTINCEETAPKITVMDPPGLLVEIPEEAHPEDTSSGAHLIYTGYNNLNNIDNRLCAKCTFITKPGNVNVTATAESKYKKAEGETEDKEPFVHYLVGIGSYQARNTVAGTQRSSNNTTSKTGQTTFSIPLMVDACDETITKNRSDLLSISAGTASTSAIVIQEKYPLQDVFAYYFARKDWERSGTQQSTPCPFYNEQTISNLDFVWQRGGSVQDSFDISIPFCNIDPSTDFIHGQSSNAKAYPGDNADGTLKLKSPNNYINSTLYDRETNPLYLRIFTRKSTGEMNDLFNGEITSLAGLNKSVTFNFFGNYSNNMLEEGKDSIGFVLSNHSNLNRLKVYWDVAPDDPKNQFWYDVHFVNNKSNMVNEALNKYTPVDIKPIKVTVYATNSRLITREMDYYSDCPISISSLYGVEWIKISGNQSGESYGVNPLPEYSDEVIGFTDYEKSLVSSLRSNSEFYLDDLNDFCGWYNCYDYDLDEQPTAYLFDLNKNGNDNLDDTDVVIMKDTSGSWVEKPASAFNKEDLYDWSRFNN